MPGYWTTTQAADYAHHSPRTLENWRVYGKGPRFVKLASGRVLYRPADVIAWIEGEAAPSPSRAA